VKERPILFSGPMVRAILEGRKTQTRRVVKPQPKGFWDEPNKCIAGGILQAIVHDPNAQNVGKVSDAYIRCPYGVPGDRLWVREALHLDLDRGWQYADTSPMQIPAESYDEAEQWMSNKRGASCPSIHMPRWASRLTLEVVSVRVERADDITDADAWTEGFAESSDSAGGCHERTTARENFLHTFYDLNERAPRGTNPWVWVVEFKRVQA
jgi:hypothetical protein